MPIDPRHGKRFPRYCGAQIYAVSKARERRAVAAKVAPRWNEEPKTECREPVNGGKAALLIIAVKGKSDQ